MRGSRWFRGLMVALTAFVLVPVLVIAGPAQEASAFVTVPPGTATVIGGLSGAGEATVLEAGAASGPPGWILDGAVLGFNLYQTRDVWMPVIKGLFGSTGASTAAPDAAHKTAQTNTPNTLDYLILSSMGVSPTDASTVVFSLGTTSTSSGGHLYSLDYNVTCALGDPTNPQYLPVFNGSASALIHPAQTVNYSYKCQSGAFPVGLTVQGTSPYGLSNNGAWNAPGLPGNSQTITTTVHCIKPDGTLFDTALDTPGDANPGYVHMPSCSAIFPGAHGTGVDVVGSPVPGQPKEKLFTDNPVTDPAYPSCSLTAPGACPLNVYVDGAQCNVGDSRCQDWLRVSQASPSRVSCQWGGYLVPVKNCWVLEGAYWPLGAPLLKVNTDGDPNTKQDPNVDPSASPTPTPEPFPTTGTNPDPNPAPGGDPATSGNGCLAGAWSFNPVNWVLVPVKCALQWAFVPDSATLTSFTTSVRTAYTATALGDWVTELGQIGTVVMPEGGCDGLHAHIDILVTQVDLHLFSTCDPPWSTLASFARGFLTLVIAWFTVTGVLRLVAAAFNLEISWGKHGS